MKTNAKKTNEIGEFFGKLYSFSNSLKLYHWHVSGPGSYAQHMALDQAIGDLSEPLDKVVETSYALYGDIKIVIPETKVPVDIVKHVSDFYDYIEKERVLFDNCVVNVILDEWQIAIQQLLYRLKRLQ